MIFPIFLLGSNPDYFAHADRSTELKYNSAFKGRGVLWFMTNPVLLPLYKCLTKKEQVDAFILRIKKNLIPRI